MDPQLWNGNFYPIFLFGVDKYLEEDAKNITYSLLKIAAFIKQHLLENRTAKNISQITEFKFVAWEFLSAIYESGWNKSMANNENRSFRQYISLQFNKTPTKNITTKKLSKGK